MNATPKCALHVDSVTVSFGAFQAVTDLSLEIMFDEIHAVIGPNGAGKTTLLDVITGKTRPKSGRVVLHPDVDLFKHSDVERVLSGIGRKFQKPSVFDALSVAQNLRLALRSKSRTLFAEITYAPTAKDRAQIDKILSEIRMTEHAGRLAGELAHGQKQWLEIGMLLVKEPKILLLDEPVAGMTDEETGHTAALIKRLKSPSRAILVIEHDISFVGEIADVVSVLHEGQLLLQGPMAVVRADPRVKDVYLGR